MLFENCERKYVIPEFRSFLEYCPSGITVRTATSPKMNLVGRAERMERIEVLMEVS
jgi:hypothetical protein